MMYVAVNNVKNCFRVVLAILESRLEEVFSYSRRAATITNVVANDTTL